MCDALRSTPLQHSICRPHLSGEEDSCRGIRACISRIESKCPPSNCPPYVLGARLRRSGWGRPRRPAKNRVLVAQNNEISYSKGKTSHIFTGHRRRSDPKLWRKKFVICDVGMVQNQQFWPQNFESLQVSPPSLFGENRGNRPRGGDTYSQFY